MGANTEGTFGDEETGYAEHARFDPGMETEGTRKRLEEVAQWKGEIDCLFSNLFWKTATQMYQHSSISLGNQVQVRLD